jgi:tetratricopeptide (TPR) repeat protein
MKLLTAGVIFLFFYGCKNDSAFITITNPQDYNSYLVTSLTPTLHETMAEKQFWSNRLDTDTSGIGDIRPLAGAYERLFNETGNMLYLKNAEHLLKKGVQIAAINYKDGFERGLAHNYISQHRFKEAKELLKTSFTGVSSKRQTKLMLFDVAMELGDYEMAYQYLTELKDMSDYNYLIRISKWSDHIGDLENAIHFMEMAKEKAETRNSKPLKIWTYSNLGDYYGHAGRIQDAYIHYLKTLELQPDNAYVKKGIAWITYAAEGNSDEALRIIDSIMKVHHLPDYHLLKSEIYAFKDDTDKANRESDQFIKAIEEGNYGGMYNTYLIDLYAETNPTKALAIAETELLNRSTPETYQLLAYAQLRNGLKEIALQTIESFVIGKTYEPKALFHCALIYEANGKSEEVKALKKELQKASFELGPRLSRVISSL